MPVLHGVSDARRMRLRGLGAISAIADVASIPPRALGTPPSARARRGARKSTTAVGSASYRSVIARAGFYGGSATLKSLVDAIRGPAERIARSTSTQPFYGHVHFVGTALTVGRSTIELDDPLYDLISGAAGKSLGFDGVPHPTSTAVIDVQGTLTTGQPLLSFPTAGADVIAALPAGTPIDVTNLTLSGNYYEVTLGRGRSSVRGYLLASAVTIGH